MVKYISYSSAFFTLLTVIGCSTYQGDRSRKIHFYSPDTTKCVTVITEGNTRYIINGDKYKYMSLSGYVKLDISGITKLGDCIHICWENEGYDWQVVVHKSTIIENKLDTTRFNVQTMLPLDNKGIPTEKKFRRDNCAIYSYYSNSLSPDNRGAIIK